MAELDSLGLPSDLLVWPAAESPSYGSDIDYLFPLVSFQEVYTRLRGEGFGVPVLESRMLLTRLPSSYFLRFMIKTGADHICDCMAADPCHKAGTSQTSSLWQKMQERIKKMLSAFQGLILSGHKPNLLAKRAYQRKGSRRYTPSFDILVASGHQSKHSARRADCRKQPAKCRIPGGKSMK